MPTNRIRVLIADDNEPVRRALSEVLHETPGFHVVAEAAHGTEAIQKFQRFKPDVVLMDVSMPRVNGEDATRLMLGMWPGTRIVALSADGSDATAKRMLAAGAHSYVDKAAAPADLIAAIRAAAAGSSAAFD